MAYPSDLVRTKNWGTEVLTDADLEGQFDLIVAWVMAAMDETTGHDHDGSANEGGPLADYTRTKQGDWILSSVTTARTGWTNVSATYADKFMRINATPLSTGGEDTHLHTGPSHTHSVTIPASSNISEAGGGGATSYAAPSHTHGSPLTTAAGGTGNTGSTSNVPAYVQVVVFQKD